MDDRRLNNKAIETLCDEIIKAVEVKAKNVCMQMNKKTGRSNSTLVQTTPSAILDAYPIGSCCLLLNGMNPHLVFGGSWERVNGEIVLITEDNTTATLTAKMWVRVG